MNQIHKLRACVEVLEEWREQVESRSRGDSARIPEPDDAIAAAVSTWSYGTDPEKHEVNRELAERSFAWLRDREAKTREGARAAGAVARRGHAPGRAAGDRDIIE